MRTCPETNADKDCDDHKDPNQSATRRETEGTNSQMECILAQVFWSLYEKLRQAGSSPIGWLD
jgi:hypothetical protein